MLRRRLDRIERNRLLADHALAALLSLDGYLFGISQRQSPAVERLRLGRQLATVTQNDIDFAPHHLAVLALANERLRLLTGVQFPMTLTDSGNGHKVTVDADDSFDHAVLWQQDAESFVCMEPWNGWANSVNEEGRHEVLEPDEAMTADWSITIEKV